MLKLAIFVLLLLTHTSAFVPHHSASCRRPSFLSVKTFDHFDMEELKKHLASWNLFETPRVPDRVYIITFQELEGYHSVEVESGRNVILAFESQQACANFASRLKSQQFFNPTPQEVSLDFLESLCDGLGVDSQIVPNGVDLLPPAQNVEQLGTTKKPGLRRERKSLDYVFAMMDGVEEEGALMDAPSGCWE